MKLLNEIPEQECIECGYRMDTASEMRGRSVPLPGMYNICLNCGEIGVFNDQMIVEKIPIESVFHVEAILLREYIIERGKFYTK